MIKSIKIFMCILLFASCKDSEISERNYENIKKIKLKSKYAEVISIMGKPLSSYSITLRENKFAISYESPIGFSDDFEIYFNGDSVVSSINYGD